MYVCMFIRLARRPVRTKEGLRRPQSLMVSRRFWDGRSAGLTQHRPSARGVALAGESVGQIQCGGVIMASAWWHRKRGGAGRPVQQHSSSRRRNDGPHHLRMRKRRHYTNSRTHSPPASTPQFLDRPKNSDRSAPIETNHPRLQQDIHSATQDNHPALYL